MEHAQTLNWLRKARLFLGNPFEKRRRDAPSSLATSDFSAIFLIAD
jgi:hypothetical protein